MYAQLGCLTGEDTEKNMQIGRHTRYGTPSAARRPARRPSTASPTAAPRLVGLRYLWEESLDR